MPKCREGRDELGGLSPRDAGVLSGEEPQKNGVPTGRAGVGEGTGLWVGRDRSHGGQRGEGWAVVQARSGQGAGTESGGQGVMTLGWYPRPPWPPGNGEA